MGPVHLTSPLPPTWDMVRTPAPSPLPTWDMVTTPPLGYGHNTCPLPPPPWDMVTTPAPPHLVTWSQHPARDYTQAGGTHPTGMHSCFFCKQFLQKVLT